MKKITVAIIASFFVGMPMFSVAYGATEFVCTIMPSGQGGDYTTLNDWNIAMTSGAGSSGCALADGTARKYPYSAMTGVISAWDNVSGSVSKTTGTVVSIGTENDGSGYIIVRNPVLGFQSGEEIRKGTNFVTITSSGDIVPTRVFSCSGASGMTDGSTVWGATSKSTGTIVHVTATQALIKSIRGTFVNGETVYKTGGSLTLADGGDQAIATAKIDGNWSSADTTRVEIRYWETSAQNYIKIYTAAAARHRGVWNASKYRLSANAQYNGVINCYEGCVWIDGLQIENTMAASGSITGDGIRNNWYGVECQGVHGELKISNNIIRYSGTDTTGRYGFWGITAQSTGCVKVWNNILFNWPVGIGGVALRPNASYYIYNNTLINCDTSTSTYIGAILFNTAWGINVAAMYLKNNLDLSPFNPFCFRLHLDKS